MSTSYNHTEEFEFENYDTKSFELSLGNGIHNIRIWIKTGVEVAFDYTGAVSMKTGGHPDTHTPPEAAEVDATGIVLFDINIKADLVGPDGEEIFSFVDEQSSDYTQRSFLNIPMDGEFPLDEHNIRHYLTDLIEQAKDWADEVDKRIDHANFERDAQEAALDV